MPVTPNSRERGLVALGKLEKLDAVLARPAKGSAAAVLHRSETGSDGSIDADRGWLDDASTLGQSQIDEPEVAAPDESGASGLVDSTGSAAVRPVRERAGEPQHAVVETARVNEVRGGPIEPSGAKSKRTPVSLVMGVRA
jgi:hypothetical protein